MSAIQDKIIVGSGASGTALSGASSITKGDSFLNGLLESSVSDILHGNFTVYGSDLFAIASLSATIFLLTWRVHHDKKIVRLNNANRRGK